MSNGSGGFLVKHARKRTRIKVDRLGYLPRRPRLDSYRSLAGVGAALVLIGCTDRSAQHGTRTAVRDSAGVRIVEHSGIPSDLPAWSVSETPDLVIGSMEGDGPDVFGRIESLVQRSDGVIVVADPLAAELRAFDRFGQPLWTAGGKGGGPGEFPSLSSVYTAPGDSVIAIGGGRLGSVFDPAGRFIRQFRFDPPPDALGGPTMLGMTATGRLVGYGVKLPAMKSGYYRTFLTVRYYDRDGRLLRQVAQLPHGEGVLDVLDGGMYTSVAVAMGRRTQFAVGARAVAVTTQERFEILRYDSNGELDLVIRVLTEPVAVDDAMRRRFMEHRRDETDEPDKDDLLAQARLRATFPETLPAVGRIHYDAQGLLWVEEYVPPYEDRLPVWWVLDEHGEFVAEAAVPAGFAMHRIGVDHVLGIVLDGLDVPYVQARQILRSAR